MATDPYANFAATPISFGRRGRLVTPGESDLTVVSKGLYVVADGSVTFVPAGNADAETLTATVTAGTTMPYLIRRVTAATATLWTIED